jgi:hypothetical protein
LTPLFLLKMRGSWFYFMVPRAFRVITIFPHFPFSLLMLG